MPAKKKHIYQEVEKLASLCKDTCTYLWENPEVGGTEQKSFAYMRSLLENAGFAISTVEKLPYAFMAEYGSGHPVIAVLGEYDALPGLSQKCDSVDKCPVVPGGPGHGCGHNMIGSAAATAAIALKNILEKEGLTGTIRFYGCPEEELLSGKVKMAYYKMFEGCDIALSWHPSSSNVVYESSYLACAYAKFYFTGLTAHAAFAPHLGRSALDAVELMNVGVNYLREHIVSDARVHYTTDSYGIPPNIVPDKAMSWYCIRAPKMAHVKHILGRIEKVAKGAAMMTETEVEIKVEHGCCEMFPNTKFTELTYDVMKTLAPPTWTNKEIQFAAQLQAALRPEFMKGEQAIYGSTEIMHTTVAGPDIGRKVYMKASSDSGDVSYMMPMNLFTVACWPFGVAPHTWQAAAFAGSSIGQKAALYAAKIMVGTGYELLTNPAKTQEIIQEFKNAKVEYSPMYRE